MGKASDRLVAIIEPAITALGYELVGIEYMSQGRHSLLRIYIDSDAGINVDDCANVSHQVSAVLDVEDPIQGEYTLEVSSPGLDRPLFTAAHFQRYSGEQVDIRMHVYIDGRKKFKGLLKGIDNGQVLVEVDGNVYELPLEDIEKAKLVPQW